MANQFTSHSPLLSNDRVYTNDEYILLVGRSVAAETYRRLHHRDIQSLQIVIEPIRKTRLVLSALAFIGFLLFGLGVWSDSSSIGVAVMLLFVGACFAGVAVFEILTAGSRCQVFATTAVQKAKLPGLTKVSHAQRFINFITPLITEAQGVLSQEELQAGLDKDRQQRQNRRPGATNLRQPRNEPPPASKETTQPPAAPKPDDAPNRPEVAVNAPNEPLSTTTGDLNDTYQ